MHGCTDATRTAAADRERVDTVGNTLMHTRWLSLLVGVVAWHRKVWAFLGPADAFRAERSVARSSASMPSGVTGSGLNRHRKDVRREVRTAPRSAPTIMCKTKRAQRSSHVSEGGASGMSQRRGSASVGLGGLDPIRGRATDDRRNCSVASLHVSECGPRSGAHQLFVRGGLEGMVPAETTLPVSETGLRTRYCHRPHRGVLDSSSCRSCVDRRAVTAITEVRPNREGGT